MRGATTRQRWHPDPNHDPPIHPPGTTTVDVNLANDPEPPYRAFLDPARFKDGQKVSLVAVARSLDGRTASSKVLRYTVRSR
jgi:hypothetical protein